MDRKEIGLLAVCLVICFGAAAIGSLATYPNISSWYSTLAKPSFSPPNWVFGPVWTLLYFLMAVSLFLVVRKGMNAKGVFPAAANFGVQLVLNVLWSVVFFGMHMPLAAFIVIAALWLSILSTIKDFNAISRNAALLLVPYILWVSFAAFLNLTVAMIN